MLAWGAGGGVKTGRFALLSLALGTNDLGNRLTGLDSV